MKNYVHNYVSPQRNLLNLKNLSLFIPLIHLMMTLQTKHEKRVNNNHYYMILAASSLNMEILQFDWFKNYLIFPVLPITGGKFQRAYLCRIKIKIFDNIIWTENVLHFSSHVHIKNYQKRKSNNAGWSWWRNYVWNNDRIASLYSLMFCTFELTNCIPVKPYNKLLTDLVGLVCTMKYRTSVFAWTSTCCTCLSSYLKTLVQYFTNTDLMLNNYY